MKRCIPFMLLFTICLTITMSVDAQSNKQKKEILKMQVIKSVETRRFKIHVTDTHSNRGMNGGGIDGSVEIKDTLLISNLPYFGNIHGVQTDASQVGLNFQSPTYDYLSSILYDGTAKILFNARRDNEDFVYYIEITPKGKATISVHSDKRSPASYSGELEFK